MNLIHSFFRYPLVREYTALFSEHAALLFGVALLIVGFFTFSSDRYCDGNPANYYSCTNPNTYYYYSPYSIALMILGATLIILSLFSLQRKNRGNHGRDEEI